MDLCVSGKLNCIVIVIYGGGPERAYSEFYMDMNQWSQNSSSIRMTPT
jgi:hypothetical protein